MKKLVKGCNHTSKAVGMADGGRAPPMQPGEKEAGRKALASMASWAKNQPKAKPPAPNPQGAAKANAALRKKRAATTRSNEAKGIDPGSTQYADGGKTMKKKPGKRRAGG